MVLSFLCLFCSSLTNLQWSLLKICSGTQKSWSSTCVLQPRMVSQCFHHTSKTKTTSSFLKNGVYHSPPLGFLQDLQPSTYTFHRFSRRWKHLWQDLPRWMGAWHLAPHGARGPRFRAPGKSLERSQWSGDVWWNKGGWCKMHWLPACWAHQHTPTFLVVGFSCFQQKMRIRA